MLVSTNVASRIIRKKELTGRVSFRPDFFAGFNIGGNIGFGGLGRVAGFGGERRIQAPIVTPRAPPRPQPKPAEPVIFSGIGSFEGGADVGILNDIVKNVVGGFTGGGVRDINAQPSSVIGNVLNDFILGQTTSRQQRAAQGTPRAGDVLKTLERDVFSGGRIGPGSLNLRIPGTSLPVGGLAQIFDTALQNIERGSMLQPIGVSMPGGNVVPISCPLPGSSVGIPAGTCLSQFDWQNAGSPRGFEIIGFGQNGQAIVKKRGRRRRRRGLTKTQMGQVSWACNLPPGCRKEVLHGIVHG